MDASCVVNEYRRVIDVFESGAPVGDCSSLYCCIVPNEQVPVLEHHFAEACRGSDIIDVDGTSSQGVLVCDDVHSFTADLSGRVPEKSVVGEGDQARAKNFDSCASFRSVVEEGAVFNPNLPCRFDLDRCCGVCGQICKGRPGNSDLGLVSSNAESSEVQHTHMSGVFTGSWHDGSDHLILGRFDWWIFVVFIT